MKTHGPNAVDAATVEPWIESLATEPERTDLEAADRALVDYALKLNDRPAAIAAGDVEALRAAGFDDRAIHDLVVLVGYYAFVNRVADGLGVELEG